MLQKIFRRQAYYIASVTFVILSLVYFVAIIDQAYIGLGLANIDGKWIVNSSDPYGEGYKLGIQVGDQILKINNQDTGEYRFVQKWSEAEGATSIEFRRIVQSTDIIIKIPKSTFLLKLLSEIPMISLGFVFWILGLITWYKRPFLAQARALFWLNWFLGLAIVLAPASSRDLIFARELEYIIFSSVPMLLIHFFSVFPSETKNQLHKFGRLILAFMFVIILSLTILQSVGIFHSIGPLRKLVLSNMTIGILLVLWNLGVLIKSSNDKPEKNQANIVLLGMAIGFMPFVLLTAVPVIFNFQPIVNTEISYLFVSVVPATLYYIIVHKYLPDSYWLLRVTIAFSLTGIIFSIVVTYALFYLKVSKTLNLEVYLATLSLTMSFVVCFNLIRVVIGKVLLKFAFFEESQDLKKRVLKLSRTLSLISGDNQILEEVVKSLTIEGAFIVLEDNKGGYLKRAVGIFLEEPSEQIKLEEYFQADQRNNLEAKLLHDSFLAEIYIPFIANDFTCGIFLGHRCSHVKFGLDQLPLITLISSQLAQRLIMTFVIKELSKEIKDLTQSSLNSQRRSQGLQGITTSLFRSLEKERQSISCEIHDGPLQLGLDLNRWLNLIEECLTNDEAKTIKAVSHMQEVVEDLNFELRRLCNDLRPPSLGSLGLLSVIETLCEEIMQKELLLISMDTVGINQEDRFKEDVELAAYHFLKEGITNVVKHSGSNQLNIHIEMKESRIELTVKDLGKGFDTSKIEDWALTGAHFGIVGMKERIIGLGGEFHITSAIGQGTMLKATILVA